MFDNKSTKHFIDSFSKISSKSNNFYNANIFIDDNDVSGKGYPDREDFDHYKISYGYIKPSEFIELQNSVKTQKADSNAVTKHKELVLFFQQFKKDNCEKIKEEINHIVDNNAPFPKIISLLYDDRLLKHTTHITLHYENKNTCKLHIDNTLPFSALVGKEMAEQIKNNYNIDIYHANESVSDLKPNFIRFYGNENSKAKYTEIEFSAPIKNIFFGEHYKRMHQILLSLDVPVKKINLNHSAYNQKFRSECVPFAIQNKLDSIQNLQAESNESVLEMAARVRSEHVVLAYLLSGKRSIPHFSNRFV